MNVALTGNRGECGQDDENNNNPGRVIYMNRELGKRLIRILESSEVSSML